MKKENQVCTLEQAKRLKELGINASCQFMHVLNNDGTYATTIHVLQYPSFSAFDVVYAPNVAELGVMLPTGFDTIQLTGDDGKAFWRGYDSDNMDYPTDDNTYPTEAQCRADMLISLLIRKKLTVAECNERLMAA